MESISWHSYPKIYNLGHVALKELLDDPVVVEEKVDGSQFSFGRFGNQVRVRSRGQEMLASNPEKMFTKAVDWVNENAHLLVDGYTYRGEFLNKPKHNCLAYTRTPRNWIVLFDINIGQENYLNPTAKQDEAERLGLEVVPTIHYGNLKSIDFFKELLERDSFLGGVKIEGVVVKNYYKFGPDKKALMGKFVSEAFKELHAKDWGERNPSSADIIQLIIDRCKTKARWAKAVQHLREAGKLEGTPKDIGLLMKEVRVDIEQEAGEELKEALWQWGRDKILRGSIRGLPEWYKEQLLHHQFEDAPDVGRQTEPSSEPAGN